MKSLIQRLVLVLCLSPLILACEGQAQFNSSGDFVGFEQVEGDYSVPLRIIKQDGTDHEFWVELASTRDEIMKGLMFRQMMGADHGMLFIFEQEMPRRFWMKNTFIPLDMIFIKSDNVIHHIHENAVPMDETTIPSNGPVSRVLEVNAGTAARLGITPGDKIEFSSE
jgi:uncharacterized membrane protein (UPF0127 family)